MAGFRSPRALRPLPKPVSVEGDRKSTDDDTAINEIDLPDKGVSPETAFMFKELSDIVQACLEGLSEKIRFVFIARELEEAKLKDLAKAFRCSLETVRQWHLQALKKMKECLKRHGWSKEDI